MKHLKRFNESNLPKGVRFATLMRNVKSRNTEYYSDDDARHQAMQYVYNVEEATEQQVVRVEGTCDESNVDLDIKLSDGENVSIWYGELQSWETGYRQFSAPGTNEIFRIKYGDLSRASNESQFKKLEKELQDEYYQNEVYYIIKDMMPEPEPEVTHEIVLPKEDYDKYNFGYDFSSYGRDSENVVYFFSEEEAQKWLDSLEIKVVKGKRDY